MKTHMLWAAACGALLAVPRPVLAEVERYALVIGANDGGAARMRLKYAVADAERFARVLHDLGGVEPDRAIVLKQPTPAQIQQAFELLRTRLVAARDAGDSRTEALVYYSGHADQAGLLLADDRVSYRSFRDSMDLLPADVRIGVIDACASGAITRLKGGKVRPPFMVDAANSMRGHAFLTSSSPNETAQESDRIAASFFTHYLVSGLRGAADVSGEGAVTLGEAYQFAFRETLGRTAETRAGAQHPAYDLNLSGTGDVVITDLRQTSARLVLSEELGGRCFVRDSEQRLVVEVMKPAGRRIELGLAPGEHEVRCQEKERARVAKVILEENRQVVLGPAEFTPGAVDRAVARGDERQEADLTGSLRVDGLVGMGTGFAQRYGGVTVSRWVRPRLALTLDVGQRIGATRAVYGKELLRRWEEGSGGSAYEEADLATTMLGARRYFTEPGAARLNPYLEASAGAYARWTILRVESMYLTPAGQPAFSLGISRHFYLRPAFRLGAGVDVRLNDSFVLGTRIGYTYLDQFPRPSVGPIDYTGFESSVSLGFRVGGRKNP